jgi:hypothetical protein
MTQQEALERAKELCPDIAHYITVSREHSIGFKHGHMEQFYIWDHSFRESEILASSNTSWEHCLAQIAAVEDNFTPDNSDFDEPEAA